MTEDCDASFARAAAAGALPLNVSQDMFWEKRTAMVQDPFGYRWSLSQVIEDVAPAEMMRRAQAFMSGGPS